MPINERDIALFSFTHPIPLPVEMQRVIEKMIEQAKEKMEKDNLDTTNCYPEISEDGEEKSVRLVIYRRVDERRGTQMMFEQPHLNAVGEITEILYAVTHEEEAEEGVRCHETD